MAAIRSYIEDEHRVMRIINLQLEAIWQNLEHLHHITDERNAFIRANLVCLRGLTPQQIENVPSVLITPELANEKTSCSVCLDDFMVDNVEKQLPCSHIFHTGCIKTWLDTHNNCPMCRQPVVEERENASTQALSRERLPMQQSQQEQQIQLPAQQQSSRQVRRRRRPSRPTAAQTNRPARSSNNSQHQRQRRNLSTAYWHAESQEHTDYQRTPQQYEQRRSQN